MLKIKSKKGFTLAELLIVVAIIAVLVAIAVPVFVSALDNAKEGVFNANVRSLKGLAVTEILTHQNKQETILGEGQDCWVAKGYWDSDGTLHLTSISAGTKSTDESKVTTFEAYKKFKKFGTDTDVITLIVTKADVSTIEYKDPVAE